MAVLGMILLPTILLAVVVGYYVTRYNERKAVEEGRVCPHCGGDLAGYENAYSCPHCYGDLHEAEDNDGGDEPWDEEEEIDDDARPLW